MRKNTSGVEILQTIICLLLGSPHPFDYKILEGNTQNKCH